MKTQKLLLVSFFLICLFPLIIIAQDISVHSMIGKTRSDVIRKYGKPVHQDNSNPAMICMFYQPSAKRLIFVSDNDGVYQSEATASYDTEQTARDQVDEIINTSVSDGFVSDTISTHDFQLYKTGVKADLQLKENKISKKFEVSIKARRSED